jgi:hypothetical protein
MHVTNVELLSVIQSMNDIAKLCKLIASIAALIFALSFAWMVWTFNQPSARSILLFHQ